MRTSIRLGIALSTLAVAACGGGGDDPDAAGGTVDSPSGTADARIDAYTGPDAPPGAFTCNGQPIPNTAPATVDIAGTTVEIGLGGQTAVPNTILAVFVAGSTTPLDSTTSSGATAAFQFTGLPTGGVPVDGYLRGTFPGARKTSYVYPPTPIYQDIDNALTVTVSETTADLLPALIEPDQLDTNGVVGIMVVDCLGNPIEGAVVSTAPAGNAAVMYRDAAGTPSTVQGHTGPDGIGIVFNVPAGDATVDVTYMSYNMREHVIQVRPFGGTANAITTTIVQP